MHSCMVILIWSRSTLYSEAYVCIVATCASNQQYRICFNFRRVKLLQFLWIMQYIAICKITSRENLDQTAAGNRSAVTSQTTKIRKNTKSAKSLDPQKFNPAKVEVYTVDDIQRQVHYTETPYCSRVSGYYNDGHLELVVQRCFTTVELT